MSRTAHQIQVQPTKTYATAANAVKAVEKLFGDNNPHFGSAQLHYLVVPTTDGRWAPVFIGERALQAGIHRHFMVTA